MFIGEKEIKSHEETADGMMKVVFKDKSETELNKELFEMIVSDYEREGGVTDAVRHVLAAEFLNRMALLDLEYYMADHVAEGIRTLAHNLREKAIANAFDCESAIDISLSKVMPE